MNSGAISRRLASFLFVLMSAASLATAAEPATKHSYSIGASVLLFDHFTGDSLRTQAAALGFDAVELTLPAGPSTAPATQFASATEPTGGQFPTLKIVGDLLGVHKDFCSIYAGPAAGGGVDGPAGSGLMVDMANGINAGVVVIPISAEDSQREGFVNSLQRLGKQTARRGVQIALDTPLDVEATNKLLDAINSPAVGIAFDPIRMSAAHNDPYQAFRLIGHRRIVQVRITSPANESLEEGLVQLPVLKEALDETGWTGWIVLQPEDGKPLSAERLRKDAGYLRSVFAP